MTGTAPAAHDEFVFHGGRRRTLRFWLFVLPIVLVVAIVALVGALLEPASDNSGGAGHIAIPVFVAVASAAGLLVSLLQWWEDETFFHIEGDTLVMRHGSHSLRGRSTHFTRLAPVTLSVEGPRGSQAFFFAQEGVRLRLGDANTAGALQPANLEAWLRTRGVKVEHG
jgi:hypothetical protein